MTVEVTAGGSLNVVGVTEGTVGVETAATGSSGVEVRIEGRPTVEAAGSGAKEVVEVHTLNPDSLEAALSAHAGSTLGVHGIADTSELETKAGASTKASLAVIEAEAYTDQHAARTTNVHGIANTAELVTNDSAPSLTLIFENGLV